MFYYPSDVFDGFAWLNKKQMLLSIGNSQKKTQKKHVYLDFVCYILDLKYIIELHSQDKQSVTDFGSDICSFT